VVLGAISAVWTSRGLNSGMADGLRMGRRYVFLLCFGFLVGTEPGSGGFPPNPPLRGGTPPLKLPCVWMAGGLAWTHIHCILDFSWRLLDFRR
jgi:hypothetical protein